MRVALGQFNAVVGDLRGNMDRMKILWDQATGLRKYTIPAEGSVPENRNQTT